MIGRRPIFTNRLIVAIVLLLLAASVALIGSLMYKPFMYNSEKLEGYIFKAIAFLKANFDEELSLIRESPKAKPYDYWLYSDNYLAHLALRRFEPGLAERIRLAILSYKVEGHGRFEVLGGQAIPDVFKDVERVLVATFGEKKVWTEMARGDVMYDWLEYADLVLLASMNQRLRGRGGIAACLFREAEGMFDGMGFRDKAFNGLYTTYKLALYLIAAEGLGVDARYREKAERILLSMQSEDGGFFTHYNSAMEPAGSTNAETTSLAILALSGYAVDQKAYDLGEPLAGKTSFHIPAWSYSTYGSGSSAVLMDNWQGQCVVDSALALYRGHFALRGHVASFAWAIRDAWHNFICWP